MKFAATYVHATLLAAVTLAIAQPLRAPIEARDGFGADYETSEVAARDAESAELEQRFGLFSLFTTVGGAIAKGAQAIAAKKKANAEKKAAAIKAGTWVDPKVQKQRNKEAKNKANAAKKEAKNKANAAKKQAKKGGKRKRDLLDLETEWDARSDLDELVARYFDLEERLDDVFSRDELDKLSAREFEEMWLDGLE